MKITLADAAEDLELICSEIDKVEEIGPVLQKAFQNAKASLEDQVDKRIRYMNYAEAMAKQARDMAQKWAQRARNLEVSLEWIKENTLRTIKTNPDLPYKGQLGAIKIYPNSIPTLRHDVKIATKSIEIVAATTDSRLPSEYYTTAEFQVIDKEKLKSDLIAQRNVPGAALEHGEHIRITLEKVK